VEIYVGNLPWSLDDQGLTNLFSQHGEVARAKVVSDRDTGRSRGFACAKVGEDMVDHRRLGDDCDDAHGSTARRAVYGADLEDLVQ